MFPIEKHRMFRLSNWRYDPQIKIIFIKTVQCEGGVYKMSRTMLSVLDLVYIGSHYLLRSRRETHSIEEEISERGAIKDRRGAG